MPHPGLPPRLPELPLFAENPPARRGQATQQAAAWMIRSHAASARARVLSYIESKRATGATIEELSICLGMKESTVCGRISELRDRYELIVDSGQRRRTSSGAEAIVWIAVP